MLDHEKPDVYKVSIEFMAIAIKIADSIPRGYSSLADQLKRARARERERIGRVCELLG